MERRFRLQPSPSELLPEPELYWSAIEPSRPLRVFENGKGIDKEQLPLTALTENFSSIDRSAPPPLGREIAGACGVRLPPGVTLSSNGFADTVVMIDALLNPDHR